MVREETFNTPRYVEIYSNHAYVADVDNNGQTIQNVAITGARDLRVFELIQRLQHETRQSLCGSHDSRNGDAQPSPPPPHTSSQWNAPLCVPIVAADITP